MSRSGQKSNYSYKINSQKKAEDEIEFKNKLIQQLIQDNKPDYYVKDFEQIIFSNLCEI